MGTTSGGSVAFLGIIFMAVIGWRMVATRKTNAGNSLFEIESYLFEVKITKDSAIKGNTIKEIEDILFENDLTIASLMHKKQYYPVPPKKHKLIANDTLILEGTQEDIDKFVSKYSLALLGADSAREAISHSPENIVMEVVISPRSSLDSKTVEQVRFKRNYGVNLLAVSREGKSHRRRLKALTLKAGDVLLIHGEKEQVEDVTGKLDCFPLAERGMDFGTRKYSMVALSIFICAIASSALGLLPIQLSLGCAVVAMVLINIIPVRELYDGVDWPVIVLLGAMIPVGGALESTGTTQVIADELLQLAQGKSLVFILAAILIITMTLSDILNNAATAILMAPIAKTIAESSGVSPDPFLMAVAIGASCAFLTPIGHQNNALVMGPGGYKFSDYWKVGLPLEILIVITSIPIILIFWPF